MLTFTPPKWYDRIVVCNLQVVSLISGKGKVYSRQHYIAKFLSDLWHCLWFYLGTLVISTNIQLTATKLLQKKGHDKWKGYFSADDTITLKIYKTISIEMDTISDLFKYFLIYTYMSYFQYYLLKTTNYKKKNHLCVEKY